MTAVNPYDPPTLRMSSHDIARRRMRWRQTVDAQAVFVERDEQPVPAGQVRS